MTMERCEYQDFGPTCPQARAQIDPITGYILNIDKIRRAEYPTLQGVSRVFAIVAAACD
jgi:hypothetical protein